MTIDKATLILIGIGAVVLAVFTFALGVLAAAPREQVRDPFEVCVETYTRSICERSFE